MTWIQRLSKMNHGVKLFFTHDVGNNTQFHASPLKHVCSFHHTDRGAISTRAPFFERRHTADALSENDCTVVFGVFSTVSRKNTKGHMSLAMFFSYKFSNTHPRKGNHLHIDKNQGRHAANKIRLVMMIHVQRSQDSRIRSRPAFGACVASSYFAKRDQSFFGYTTWYVMFQHSVHE